MCHLWHTQWHNITDSIKIRQPVPGPAYGGENDLEALLNLLPATRKSSFSDVVRTAGLYLFWVLRI